jgi:hypothetical protein
MGHTKILRYSQKEILKEIPGKRRDLISWKLRSFPAFISRLEQKDYATAEKFSLRVVDLNEKVWRKKRQSRQQPSDGRQRVYGARRLQTKAETYLVRASSIDESLFGRDSINILMPLFNVCTLYHKWGKPDQLEPCDRQLLAVLEKQYGANSPEVVSTLTSEAQVLRTLGRPKEAESVEDRLASIRSATMVRPWRESFKKGTTSVWY